MLSRTLRNPPDANRARIFTELFEEATALYGATDRVLAASGFHDLETPRQQSEVTHLSRTRTKIESRDLRVLPFGFLESGMMVWQYLKPGGSTEYLYETVHVCYVT